MPLADRPARISKSKGSSPIPYKVFQRIVNNPESLIMSNGFRITQTNRITTINQTPKRISLPQLNPATARIVSVNGRPVQVSATIAPTNVMNPLSKVPLPEPTTTIEPVYLRDANLQESARPASPHPVAPLLTVEPAPFPAIPAAPSTLEVIPVAPSDPPPQEAANAISQYLKIMWDPSTQSLSGELLQLHIATDPTFHRNAIDHLRTHVDNLQSLATQLHSTMKTTMDHIDLQLQNLQHRDTNISIIDEYLHGNLPDPLVDFEGF